MIELINFIGTVIAYIFTLGMSVVILTMGLSAFFPEEKSAKSCLTLAILATAGLYMFGAFNILT
jgi:hypothetical protein